MFVENCEVTKEERLVPRQQNNKQKCVEEESEIFYPVLCTCCDAELGVQDIDDVFHFFNVIPANV